MGTTKRIKLGFMSRSAEAKVRITESQMHAEVSYSLMYITD